MERRLAAILAADVVGYSRLMGEDELRTLADLKSGRTGLIDPKIAEYSGRIVKEMGDGLLVEFPSVVDAVRCAIEIQRGMSERGTEVPAQRRIDLRIGINLGDVIVEDGDLFGDGVNVAARLEGLAEPGGICMSRAARDQVRDKLNIALDDLGEINVKNIRRPVRAFRVVLGDAAAGKRPGRRGPWFSGARLGLSAGLAGLLVASALFALLRPWTGDVEPASVERMAFPLPNRPSIAVLPFQNLGDNVEQGYFADGITDDLITELSKISGLFVIGRNSSFAYRDGAIAAHKVAEDLGVRYVLQGSVRRVGDQVRINARLIDATSGQYLWAARYDGTMVDIFGFQDQVTGNIVATLAINLTGPEEIAKGRLQTTEPEAYDAFLRGWSHYRRNAPDDLALAKSEFERAIALDPNYGRAHAALAAVYAVAVESDRLGATTLWSRVLGMNTSAAIVEMGRHLERPLQELDPLAYQVASGRSSFTSRHDDAIALADRAIALHPNDPAGHKALASAHIFAGQSSLAAPEIRLAMRLDPHYAGTYLFWLGLAQFGMERFEEAAETLAGAARSNADDERVLIVLAAAYGHLGQEEMARDTIAKADRLRIARQQGLSDPTLQLGIDQLLVGPYSLDDVNWWPFRQASDRQRLREGLRAAIVAQTDAEGIASPRTVPGATTVDAAMAKDLHERAAIFIDVRDAAVWMAGHVPGAFNLYFKTDFAEAALAAVAEKDRPVVVYCAGPRCLLSSEACRLAVAWGFQRVYYFRDGFPAWKAAGYSIEVPKI